MRTNDSSGWEWGRIREKKLAQNRRDNNGQCEAREYGCLGDATEVHHVVSRVHGGGDNDKLLALCSECHLRYTAQLNQKLWKERKAAEREAHRKNRPGRKDRHE